MAMYKVSLFLGSITMSHGLDKLCSFPFLPPEKSVPLDPLPNQFDYFQLISSFMSSKNEFLKLKIHLLSSVLIFLVNSQLE